MKIEILPHTSELKVKIQARTIEDLFITALKALFTILKPQKAHVIKNTQRILSVSGSDQTILLINFLNDLLALSQIHKEAYTELCIQKFTDTSLLATIKGHRISKFLTDIKAVTYHLAEIVKNRKGLYETSIIFDI